MFRRIVLIKPCCLGDIIFATPLLAALRRSYPNAVIDWAAGDQALPMLRGHPSLGGVRTTGTLANPASRPGSLLRLVRILRAGRYDLAVVPDRSPLLGLASLLAGISHRAGLDSAGRGFAYTVRAPIDPAAVRHEAEIYLDVARALGLEVSGCWANVPPRLETLAEYVDLLDSSKTLILVHPGGGVNAGMTMTEKRWPARNFAALADRLADLLGGQIGLIGIESDRPALDTFRSAVQRPIRDLTNQLSLPQIGALASQAALYLGNDNGVAHLAAASGGRVLMIFGPSDPRRYAPFVPPERARAVWRRVELPSQGVRGGLPRSFDWERDGATVEDAWQAALSLLQQVPK